MHCLIASNLIKVAVFDFCLTPRWSTEKVRLFDGYRVGFKSFFMWPLKLVIADCAKVINLCFTESFEQKVTKKSKHWID